MSAAPAQCPACGGELAHWRSVASSEPGLEGQRFELFRCRRCGTAVTAGRAPASLHEAGAYRPGTPRLYMPARPVLSLFDRQRLALVRRLGPPPAQLLDAGAGRGRFVLAAARAGYDAVGVEPSQRGAEAAAELGARVTRASIEDAQINPDSVDLVTLWHVLEHLDDPASALSTIRPWLRPRGGLLVGVPNLASLQARLGGDRWYHLDIPRHRVHFTERGVRALLRRQGFTVLGTRHLLLEHNPFGMWQSWLNRFTTHPSYVYNLLKRNAPLRSPDLAIALAVVPLAPVAALVELAAALAGRGGTIAVLARRED
jgi:SAM-dependent methyltransferase